MPLPPPERPARFASWEEAIVAWCDELWSSIGAKNAGRTALLLARSLAGRPLRVTRLSEAQLAACVARGAVVEPPDDPHDTLDA